MRTVGQVLALGRWKQAGKHVAGLLPSTACIVAAATADRQGLHAARQSGWLTSPVGKATGPAT